MNNPMTFLRWQEFLDTLSQILNINIAVIDKEGKLVLNLFKTDYNDLDYFELFSDYEMFYYEIISNIDSNYNIFNDPFGLLFAIVPLTDKNYLILGGVGHRNIEYKLEEVGNQQGKCKVNNKIAYIGNNQVLMSREELILKAKSAKKLYDQLLTMSQERSELGQKMMLLTALEEYDKLLLSLIQPESFNISPLLDLVSSSLIILFDAEASWAFSYCNDQYYTVIRGNYKELLKELSGKWIGIAEENKEAIKVKETWLKTENNLLYDYNKETISFVSEEFGVTIGLIAENNGNIKEALRIFSGMMSIALEMQSLFRTLNYRLGYLLKYLRQGVMIVNSSGKIITFNKAAKDFFAYQGLKLYPGYYYNDYFLDKKINRALEDVIETGVEHLQKKSIVENESGQKYLKWDVVPLKDKDEKNKGAILVFEDITEITYLKNQIQEQERKAIAGNLAAGFAHEIRNPLSVAGGAIQLLEIVDDPKRKVDLIHKLRRELDRINQILTDFLDIAKTNKKKELKPIKLPKVIDEIEFLIKSDANLNNIRLTVDKNPDDFPLIMGDSTQLKQVFLNIMKNAIEAMNDGGELKIAYYYNSDRVSIIFEDNGPGIPEKHLPLILRSFFTTKVEGTGLGLSVSSELIKNMGGDLKIESEVGEGTIVRIIFPTLK